MDIKKRDFLLAGAVLGAAAAASGAMAQPARNKQPSSADMSYKPRRLNKCIELWEDGQPIYYTGAGVGPHDYWSSGGLFDNTSITGTQLLVANLSNEGTGHGWAGANYVLWNDQNNSEIDSYDPPTAQNWVIGGSASTIESFGNYPTSANGNFVDFNQTVQPQSLYQAQLLDRETPTVQTAAAASPGTVTGKTTSLSVLGADVAGESTLTYTWSTLSGPSGAPAVTYSSNGANASKNTTATFGMAGAYTLQVTIQFPGGFSVTSSVNVTVSQTANSITVSPQNMSIPTDGNQQYSDTIYDQFGNLMTASADWSATGGSITNGGFYTAPAVPGTFTIKATLGSVSGSTSVIVQEAGPSVVDPAAAMPNPVTGTSTALTTLGSDPNGESTLTYTWTTLGTPPAPVNFSVNGTNAAKNTTATFGAAGAYQFQVTMTDANEQSAMSDVTVVVDETATTISVTPGSSSLSGGQVEQFIATAHDQFGNLMATSFRWSANGGTIANSGIFTAPAGSGIYTVTATSGSASGNGTVIVGDPALVITTPASASPATINAGGSTTLAVAASGGTGSLTYTWSTVAAPSGATAPTFGSSNGTTTGNSTSVTVPTAGAYIFHVTIEDTGGSVVSANVSVNVNATTDQAAILATHSTYSSSNLALQSNVTATSTATGSSTNNIVDGNTSTSWTSGGNGYQVLNLDLGGTSLLTNMTLDWGTHYASQYAVQIYSGGRWLTVYETNKGVGGDIYMGGFYNQVRYARIILYKTAFTNYMINGWYVYGK